jgi:hypothetical protein
MDVKVLFRLLFFIVIVLSLSACRTGRESGLTTEKPALAVFLDSLEASVSIISDDADHLFEHISGRDIEIQMKRTSSFSDRDAAVAAYKDFLRRQVSDWTTEEKSAILNLVAETKRLCDRYSPRLFPQGLRFIKIKTGHYGGDVFYTRGTNICVPENIFPMKDSSRYLPVMIHEVFHVISRYNPSLRDDLYSLIGFERSPKPIKSSENLKAWMLTNPDGVEHKHFLRVKVKDSTYMIVPAITAKLKNFRPSQPAFFDYLAFDLYKLTTHPSYYEITSDTFGKTTLPMEASTRFFDAIKDNTQYIIHPEEIMADNFMLGLFAGNKNEYSKFSPAGKQLIEKVLERLAKE